MTSRSTKLSPAWVLTVVTADSFLLFPNNMFHSLNSIVIGNRAIPSYSAETHAIRSIHGFTFVLTWRGFDEIVLGDFSLAPPSQRPCPQQQLETHDFPATRLNCAILGERLFSALRFDLIQNHPANMEEKNPVVPVVARMHLLFLAGASIKLETLTRRGICRFILPHG